MYCVKCGQQLSETSKFCNQCGTPVTRTYTAQKGVRPPAPPHAKVRGNKKLALWLGVGLPALAVLVFLGLWLGPRRSEIRRVHFGLRLTRETMIPD